MYLKDQNTQTLAPIDTVRPTAGGPQIQPGQIWLIEQSAARAFAARDQAALAGADVVLYEKPLAPLVPRGRYAEPLAANPEAGASAIAPRALKLASEGWRVVQLIERCPIRRRRLRDGIATAPRPDGDRWPAVQVVAKGADDQIRCREASWPQLPGLIGDYAEEDALTVIVGPLAGGIAPAVDAGAGNGLAG
jgi:hypothetical protein